MALKPTVGRIVLYRSRTGKYTVPAIITATLDSLNMEGVEAGYVPMLTSEDHVHLTVFTPGTPGLRTDARDFVHESPFPVSENVAGCYQEWNIAPANAAARGMSQNADPSNENFGPGTWAWPQKS